MPRERERERGALARRENIYGRGYLRRRYKGGSAASMMIMASVRIAGNFRRSI